MMANISVLGIDLAKNVFQLHGVDRQGKKVLGKRLTRAGLIEFVSNLKPCAIAIEACMGSHHWGRLFKEKGHSVKIMAPQFVKPYVKSNKNDRNDAAAIAEAATRPDMRFVGLKTINQQDILLLHRARELVIKQRIALANHIRGLLQEYGIVVPVGKAHMAKLPELLDSNKDSLSDGTKAIFLEMFEQYKTFLDRSENYELKIKAHIKNDAKCQAIMEIEGVGPITASAIVATIGNAFVFKNGREVAAWLGLVPKQFSSGNKIRLGGISKRGDKYVRQLLVHGGRSVVRTCGEKTDRRSLWVFDKKIRCGENKAAVAVANKNARIIWAMLTTGECYKQINAAIQHAA
jgi:transposase